MSWTYDEKIALTNESIRNMTEVKRRMKENSFYFQPDELDRNLMAGLRFSNKIFRINKKIFGNKPNRIKLF